MRVLIFGIALSLISTSCISQQIESPDKIITDFFDLYKTRGPREALDFLFSKNKWMDKENESITSLEDKIVQTSSQLGKFIAYEKITEKSVNESFVLYSYMLKYERQPIRFNFVFYKPKDDWQLQNLLFDTKLEDELDKAATLFYLPYIYKQ